jgi:hypothetical protein
LYNGQFLLVHKLEVLEQWNSYYKRNRERILKRKKELREAKERMLNETPRMQKMERRGRKSKGIDLENILKKIKINMK